MEATENQENPVIQDAEDEEAAGEAPERDGAGNSDVWESLPDDQKTETVSNGTTDAETVTETEPESETETESEGRMETETETETESELCAQTRASKVGVLAGGELMMNEEGSAQGNIISPILANIYMHNVLTLWYKFIITKECKTQLRIFCQFVFFRDTDIELLLKISSNFLKVSFWLDFSKKNYRITIHSSNHDILKNL